MSNQSNTSVIERAVELADEFNQDIVYETVEGYVNSGDLEGLYGYVRGLEIALHLVEGK